MLVEGKIYDCFKKETGAGGHITRKVAIEFSVHLGHEHINLEKIGHARLRGFVS